MRKIAKLIMVKSQSPLNLMLDIVLLLGSSADGWIKLFWAISVLPYFIFGEAHRKIGWADFHVCLAIRPMLSMSNLLTRTFRGLNYELRVYSHNAEFPAKAVSLQLLNSKIIRRKVHNNNNFFKNGVRKLCQT